MHPDRKLVRMVERLNIGIDKAREERLSLALTMIEKAATGFEKSTYKKTVKRSHVFNKDGTLAMGFDGSDIDGADGRG